LEKFDPETDDRGADGWPPRDKRALEAAAASALGDPVADLDTMPAS
jgi:hypothetical protein